ncbi:hypothetical protein BT96DRAFT_742474, partial [Gymnopus androsaceus JB14]
FPVILKIVLAHLTIKAVLVERVFSKSHHICIDLWSSLKSETIWQALLSKVWIHAGLFEVNEP